MESNGELILREDGKCFICNEKKPLASLAADDPYCAACVCSSCLRKVADLLDAKELPTELPPIEKPGYRFLMSSRGG